MERARLREAAGVTQARLAQVLKSTTQTVKNWENGRSEPRPPRLQAYQRLLEGWAAKYPLATVPETLPDSVEQPAAPRSLDEPAQPSMASAPVPDPVRAASPARPPASRRPAAQKTASKPAAAAAAVDERFANGPLAVLDGDGSAYCVGGLVLDCPAKTVPALVDWTLSEAQLGASRLHSSGKDADPLIVLTAAAAERLGLPRELEDRRGLRLPEDHKVVRQLVRAKWQLTRRGFGPWARIYR